jgi:hypothetical protein
MKPTKKNVNLKEDGNENTIIETKKKLINKIRKDTINEKEWFKFCKCGNKQLYTTKRSLQRAEKIKTVCRFCANSDENNPFFGKSHTQLHKNNLSEKQKNCSYRYINTLGKNPDKINKNCKFCNVTFQVARCQNSRLYCSFKCAAKDCFGLGEGKKTTPEIFVENYLIQNKINII